MTFIQTQKELTMKRFIFLSVLLMSMVIYGSAFAAEPEAGKKFTFVGKLWKDGMVYVIMDDKYEPTFPTDSIKDATSEFRQCIDDGKYAGIVEITANVEFIARVGSPVLELDKSAFCKRR